MKQIESELETLQEKLHKIKTWIDAYPLAIFPEPDFKKAHEVLKQHGMSLDAISASNMRHMLNGIKDILETKCE
jgi:DNA-binding FadR family transcriptional regulator